jgi:hypothetical protein
MGGIIQNGGVLRVRSPLTTAGLAVQSGGAFSRYAPKTTVSEAMTGIGERNVGLLIAAALHAPGRCQIPDSGRWPAA